MRGHSEFVWKQARSWDLFFQAGGGGGMCREKELLRKSLAGSRAGLCRAGGVSRPAGTMTEHMCPPLEGQQQLQGRIWALGGGFGGHGADPHSLALLGRVGAVRRVPARVLRPRPGGLVALCPRGHPHPCHLAAGGCWGDVGGLWGTARGNPRSLPHTRGAGGVRRGVPPAVACPAPARAGCPAQPPGTTRTQLLGVPGPPSPARGAGEAAATSVLRSQLGPRCPELCPLCPGRAGELGAACHRGAGHGSPRATPKSLCQPSRKSHRKPHGTSPRCPKDAPAESGSVPLRCSLLAPRIHPQTPTPPTALAERGSHQDGLQQTDLCRGPNRSKKCRRGVWARPLSASGEAVGPGRLPQLGRDGQREAGGFDGGQHRPPSPRPQSSWAALALPVGSSAGRARQGRQRGHGAASARFGWDQRGLRG